MAISMLKIRRPLGRLIFNMGIAIPGKTVFLIETAPWKRNEVMVGIWAADALMLKHQSINSLNTDTMTDAQDQFHEKMSLLFWPHFRFKINFD